MADRLAGGMDGSWDAGPRGRRAPSPIASLNYFPPENRDRGIDRHQIVNRPGGRQWVSNYGVPQMPIKDLLLLCFFASAFGLFAAVLAYGDWMEAQARKRRDRAGETAKRLEAVR
ncbi:MAG TPA: hypothetical protein VMU31_01585 [Rhizomicrobium sp.]|nr:hypothetical protein [Rhizomicrobium sp.]